MVGCNKKEHLALSTLKNNFERRKVMILDPSHLSREIGKPISVTCLHHRQTKPALIPHRHHHSRRRNHLLYRHVALFAHLWVPIPVVFCRPHPHRTHQLRRRYQRTQQQTKAHCPFHSHGTYVLRLGTLHRAATVVCCPGAGILHRHHQRLQLHGRHQRHNRRIQFGTAIRSCLD